MIVSFLLCYSTCPVMYNFVLPIVPGLLLIISICLFSDGEIQSPINVCQISMSRVRNLKLDSLRSSNARLTLSVKDRIHSTEARVLSSESLVSIIEGRMLNLLRVADKFTLRIECRALNQRHSLNTES
jgi:hypothetical protein